MYKFKLSLNKKSLKKISLALSLALALTATNVPLATTARAEETDTSSLNSVKELNFSETPEEFTFNDVQKVPYGAEDMTDGDIVGQYKPAVSSLINIDMTDFKGKGLKITFEDADDFSYYRQSHVFTRTEKHNEIFSCFKGRTYNVKMLYLGGKEGVGSFKVKISTKKTYESILPTDGKTTVELDNLSTASYSYVPNKTGIYQLTDLNQIRADYYVVPVKESDEKNLIENNPVSTDFLDEIFNPTMHTCNEYKEIYLEKDKIYYFVFQGTETKKIALKPKLEYASEGIDEFVVTYKNNLKTLTSDYTDNMLFDVHITYKPDPITNKTIEPFNKTLSLMQMYKMEMSIESAKTSKSLDIANKGTHILSTKTDIKKSSFNENDILSTSSLAANNILNTSSLAANSSSNDTYQTKTPEEMFYRLMTITAFARITKNIDTICDIKYLDKTTQTNIKITSTFEYAKKHAKKIAIDNLVDISNSTEQEHFFSFTGKTGAYQINNVKNTLHFDSTMIFIYDSNGNIINANNEKAKNETTTFYLKNGKKYYVYYTNLFDKSSNLFSSYLNQKNYFSISESKEHKHVAVIDKGKAATYTHTGLTTGSHCKVCEKILKKQTVIPKKALPKLNKTQTTIKKGEKFTLKLSGATSKVSWITSNKKIASVTNSGIVTGIKKGKAIITANFVGKKYRCIVTVK